MALYSKKTSLIFEPDDLSKVTHEVIHERGSGPALRSLEKKMN